MQQFMGIWSGLDPRRRAVVALAALAMFAAVLGLSRMATAPSMALLYSGLDGAQSGEVLQALDQQGARYEVRGDAVFVEQSRRDELRMQLAGQGLPRIGSAGYELLDGLSGFGTTSQMFDAAYWRAKEGELARTIVSHGNIGTARVHIANPASTPFQRDMQPSASVTVGTVSGALSTGQAEALQFLVASAVAGLQPENVAIIDGSTGRVIDSNGSAGDAMADRSDAADIKARVERLLHARVGPGRAIVEVSIDRVRETESIVERRIDPDSRVAISSDTEETVSSSQNSGGAAVTVASNLPAGDAGDGEGESSARNSETRERVNFDVSETTREISRSPGGVKRLTVAVLVDGVTGPDGWVPRGDEELTDLRDLVASAVGFDENRGDSITIRSLAFDEAEALGTAAAPQWSDGLLADPIRLVQLATLAVVALVLGLLVVRPVLLGRRNAGQSLDAEDMPAALGPPPSDTAYAAAEPAGAVDDVALPQLGDGLATMGDYDYGEFDTGMPASLPSLEDDPVAHLKALIETRQPDTIEILKTWLDPETTDMTERA